MERDREVTRLLGWVSREKGWDLEAWEEGLRTAVLAAGGRLLEAMLRPAGRGKRKEPVLCPCGRRMRSLGPRYKRLYTVVGVIRFRRSLYRCPACGRSRFPADEQLGVEDTGFSPGLRRLMARAGSRTPFAEAQEDLQVYAKVSVDRKDIERVCRKVGQALQAWMARQQEQAIQETRAPRPGPQGQPIPVLYVSFDGTGVPMRPEELQGRKGKQPDGRAKTREVKVGCVFTQTTTDDQGRPVRDPASTTYTAAIESSEEFGWRIYAEARQRGLDRATTVAVLTDGASYNTTIVQTHFPHAVHIIDLYHARQHLFDLSRILLSEHQQKSLQPQWLAWLDEGNIQALLLSARQHLPWDETQAQPARKHIQYFQDHAQQMRYAQFKERGLFVGSGVVEAGCRTLITQRLKRSGMFWSLLGANAIIALRTCQLSGRFESFWEDQAA